MFLYLRRLVGDEGSVYLFEMDQNFCNHLRNTIPREQFSKRDSREFSCLPFSKKINIGDGYCDYSQWIKNFPELAISTI